MMYKGFEICKKCGMPIMEYPHKDMCKLVRSLDFEEKKEMEKLLLAEIDEETKFDIIIERTQMRIAINSVHKAQEWDFPMLKKTKQVLVNGKVRFR